MKLPSFVRLFAAVAACCATVSSPASAAYVVNAYEVGGNVVLQGAGSLNTTGLTLNGSGGAQSFIEPFYIPNGSSGLRIGSPTNIIDWVTSYSGTAAFGTGSGSFTVASSGTGSGFGYSTFSSDSNAIIIDAPTGYVSGSQLSGSATFNGQTFNSLGLVPGTYQFTLRSGVDADTFTINVLSNLSAVPEPATWAMMLVGFGGIGFAMRRKQTTALAQIA